MFDNEREYQRPGETLLAYHQRIGYDRNSPGPVELYTVDVINSLQHVALPQYLVYFIFSKGKLMYVGQSQCGLRRIGEHSGRYSEMTYTYIVCPRRHLNHVEQFYIKKYQPPHNYQHTYKSSAIGRQLLREQKKVK